MSRAVLTLAAVGAVCMLPSTALSEPRRASRPTSRTIAFTSWRDGDPQIFVMTSDGRRQVRLIRSLESSLDPSWSPDGRRLVFVGTNAGRQGVFIAGSSGSPVRRLTSQRMTGPASLVDGSPQWSPNGRALLFQRAPFVSGGRSTIYRIRPDGRGLRKLGLGAEPAWSPGGRRIAFTALGPGGQAYIYIANADGTHRRRLTSEDSYAPAWSPDGRWIAFASARDGNSEIYVVSTRGGPVRRLTRLAAYDYGPSWSPDGRKIAFMSRRIGNQADIYVMNPDGSRQRRLTRDLADDSDPAWRP